MTPEDYDAHRHSVALSTEYISYVDTGGASAPALFVHGLMLNNAVWRQVTGKLKHLRRCLAPDLLGHGRSQVSEKQDLSLRSQADMLAHFCEALDLKKVDVIANDFGGAVAQVFAVRHPHLVRTLILTNCDTHYNYGPPADIRRIFPLAQAGTLGETVAAMLNDINLARSFFPGRGFADTKNLTDEIANELLAPAFTTEIGRRNFERFILSLRENDLAKFEADLKKLSVSVLLVWGTEDSYFGLPWAFWLRDILAGDVTLAEIEHGHLFIPIERPDDVVAAISDFWETSDRREL